MVLPGEALVGAVPDAGAVVGEDGGVAPGVAVLGVAVPEVPEVTVRVLGRLRRKLTARTASKLTASKLTASRVPV